MAGNVTLPAVGTGSTTPIIESTQNSGDSSQRQIVSVAGLTVQPTDTPAVTASAYTAGNVVGGVLSFSNAVRTQNAINSGRLQNVLVTSKSTQALVEMDLYLFNANPTGSTFTDKAAPAIAAADIPKLIAKVALMSVDANLGANYTSWQALGIGLVFQLGSGNTTLYAVLVTRGTPTFASTSDITVTLGIQDD